uniref:Phytosulfokine-alpha n=1 Tax=Daucus carota TaxID=4039 RepID=PSK_DAUCA
YIYTQ